METIGSVPAVPSNEPIPTYRIDLSLPPAERYVQVATELREKMQALTGLLDEILDQVIYAVWMRKCIHTLARMLLRRVYSKEQNEELKGISRASGIDFFLLVALNVLLDVLLGCTSGAVMTTVGKRSDGEEPEKRMLHFRTLDWAMDGLRSVLVVLEFVRSDSPNPEKVIARTITYAGFVGVLTGVRENLSISLNFRPHHYSSMYSLRLHQLGVVLGLRPSISSILRDQILPNPYKPPIPLPNLSSLLSRVKSSPCYLILCDGTQGIVLEKNFIGARISSSKEFIVQTNHDIPSEAPNPLRGKVKVLKGMDDLVEDSEARRECVEKKWKGIKSRQERKWKEKMEDGEMPIVSVREDTLRNWVRAEPTMNDESHFVCILDPKLGTVRFLARGVVEKEGGLSEAEKLRAEVGDITISSLHLPLENTA